MKLKFAVVKNKDTKMFYAIRRGTIIAKSDSYSKTVTKAVERLLR